MALDANKTYHVVEGDLLHETDVRQPLAASLLRFVKGYGGHEVVLDGICRLQPSIEVVMITMKTGAPQVPVYAISNEEKLAVLFEEGIGPAVVPLRHGFPTTPHSYGLPMKVPISAPLVICIDDRPWCDAVPDYTGAEIVRRIASWFRRAAEGEMNDELQFVEPAFLPAPQTIAVPNELYAKLMEIDGAPITIALTSSSQNSKIFLAKEYTTAEAPNEAGTEWIPHVSMPIGITFNQSNGMYRPPSHLGQLTQGLKNTSPDLIEQMRDLVQSLITNSSGEDLKQLYQTRLLINVAIRNEVADRYEAICLIPEAKIGDIGVALGLLYSPEADVKDYTVRFPKGDVEESALSKVRLSNANLCQSFDRTVAPFWSGRSAPEGHAIAFGAGAIGSQVMNHLVREGAFSELCIVDDDYLQPHNLARHLLRSDCIGHSKASAVAAELMSTRPDLKATSIDAKLTRVRPPEVDAGLMASNFAIDLTASVGASRELSDYPNRGRAACAFFNPTGDAVIVMIEDQERKIDLAALEALYYGEIIKQPFLYDHLKHPEQTVVSSGQCRSTTSQIPSSDSAILSGLAARDISKGFGIHEPFLSIRTMQKCGAISGFQINPAGEMFSKEVGGWTVRAHSSTIDQMRRLRAEAAPNETGGLLLGIVDHARQRIEVVVGLSAPVDSVGTPISFERGIVDLRSALETVSATVMHQITYIGEWHSHPNGARAMPSVIDRRQLNALAVETAPDERPAVMIIVANDDVGIFSLDCVR